MHDTTPGWRLMAAMATMAATLAVLLSAGCRTADAPDAAGGPPGAATKDELADRVQAAITANDMDAMMRLYHWEGVDEQGRQRVRTTVEGYFQGSIVSTEFQPLAPGYGNEFIRDGTLYRPNLPLEGHLRVRYGDDRTGPRTAVAFPYAVAGDRFVLPVVLRSPVDTSDARNRQLSLIVHGDGPAGRVAFAASCRFMVGDEEREESFEGDRGSTRVFWGRHFTRCSVRKVSDGGWLQFRLRRGREEVVFDSDKIEDDREAVWILEGESDG